MNTIKKYFQQHVGVIFLLISKIARAWIVGALCVLHLTSHAGVETHLVGDDAAAGPFPIGFVFRFYGKEYTEFNVTTNGLIQFASHDRDYTNYCLPSLLDTIYVFWDDLRTDAAGQPTGKIQYQTINEYPNRKLIIQWTNQYFYGSNLPMGTFQAVLSETTNEVKLQYRFLREDRSTGESATIGIQGGTTQIMQHGCNQSNVISPEMAISYIPDAAGLEYKVDVGAPYGFIDISDLTPSPPIAAARFTNGSPSWSWQKIDELNSYQIEIQTDAGETIYAEVLGDVDSFTWGGRMDSGESYRARVRGSVNSGGTWELWSGLSQVVTIDLDAPEGRMLAASQTGPGSVLWRFQALDDLSGVESARLQIASDPEFQNVLWDDFVPETQTSYSYAGAVPSQRLYGRLNVRDKAGNFSSESNIVDVLVLPAPTADFDPTVLSGESPLDVAFGNKTTGSPASYWWDFGDGRTSSESSPIVRFSQPNVYDVSLQASGIGGTTRASKTITVTPDVTMPSMEVLNGEIGVGDQLSIDQAVTLILKASDKNGIKSIFANFAGNALSPVKIDDHDIYQIVIDPLQYSNGIHELLAGAEDQAGNFVERNVRVNINLPAPSAPNLIEPKEKLRTNQDSVVVRGTTSQGAEAILILNGEPQGDWFGVVNQEFQGAITLVEGKNRIAAMVRNNRGSSAISTEIVVTLDTSKPSGPTLLRAVSQPQGKVRLTWAASSDPNSAGYDLYRSQAAFADIGFASKANASSIRGTSYEDLPDQDGIWFYRVVAVNSLGTTSAVSDQVQVFVDRDPPKALSVIYQPEGKADTATGRIGQGKVNVQLKVSEELQAAPYLAVVPAGGSPIVLELTKGDATTYTSAFFVNAQTPSGIANTLFSARDAVGNRGTEIDAGATLKIDTEGPALSSTMLNPPAPIKAGANTTVQATFVFSKTPKAGVPPQIKYLLSGSGRQPTAIAGLTSVDAVTWEGSFTLPSDAGLTAPEILSFSNQTQDDLDNVSTQVTAANRFQVYQGNLPPANAPLLLIGKAIPGGKAALTWQSVDEAFAYQVYRKGPSDAALEVLARASGPEYVDQTPADGSYTYAVASIRSSNGEETVSSQSATVDVATIANGPGAPQNLTLLLTGQGIKATWQAPVASPVDYYNLYRASGTSITSVDDLTPVKTRVKNPITYDPQPSPSQSAYVVTAVDVAGNESAVSNSAYLNTSLLPVVNLRVEQIGNTLPVISWQAPNGNLTGYNVYVGPDANLTKLTPSPITATSISDSGFSGGERRYTVASVDAAGEEIGRSLTLPAVSTQIVSGLPIKRGIMNRVQAQVVNTSAEPLVNARVIVRMPTSRAGTQFAEHKSEPFDLGSNQTQLVTVVIGGYAELSDQVQAMTGIESSPHEGETVLLGRNQTFDIGDSALVVGMTTGEFTRGATGKVRLTIENTSAVEVEFLTATGGGNNPSTELRFKIVDADGNVLATQPYKQSVDLTHVPFDRDEVVVKEDWLRLRDPRLDLQAPRNFLVVVGAGAISVPTGRHVLEVGLAEVVGGELVAHARHVFVLQSDGRAGQTRNQLALFVERGGIDVARAEQHADGHLTDWSDIDATRPAGQQTTSAKFTYDDAGRKTSETVIYPNPAGGTYSLGYTYQYSPAGYKTQLTWADGTRIGYAYSQHGVLETVIMRRVGTALAALVGCIGLNLAAQAQGAATTVTPPNGILSAEVVDLSVQTSVGPVEWKRTFNGVGCPSFVARSGMNWMTGGSAACGGAWNSLS
ncbi:PKD domain-containing protein [Variovorax sp. Sphag1AA]|uniref:PKD domain-containing protein n=1 Tax=Variovorax sp. Sphag1AA TaxID=2587027 RepID=UPI00160ED6E1|nr:PKD domain-containing protein [Variovorax sp. Sphag1AA]MBB3176019.1 PKD repeat protein [Variovorax sp. Sphag1AA]